MDTNINELREANVSVKAQHGVEISIARNRAFIWVNVDGICALRVRLYPSTTLTIEDMRNPVLK